MHIAQNKMAAELMSYGCWEARGENHNALDKSELDEKNKELIYTFQCHFMVTIMYLLYKSHLYNAYEFTVTITVLEMTRMVKVYMNFGNLL